MGALSFRNQYDGHTLQKALEQTSRLTAKAPVTATVDRGYRGISHVGNTQIIIPKSFVKSITKYKQNKLRKHFKRRAAIEPVNGHLKTDNRLNRNFYKGIFGDNINVMLRAAAFNFKRMMNKWKSSFSCFFETLVFILVLLCNPLLQKQLVKKSF